MKIYLDPNPGKRPDRTDGGIRRVLDAQIKYLPEFGIRVTKKIESADLTAGHVDHLPIATGKPFVTHCHGLMWGCYFPENHNREINRAVVNALKQADAITVPSKWVANALGYGLLRTPRVIYHGVDLEEWNPPAEPGAYVLWNKARADAVSDPRDVMRLAKLMPQTRFVSTLGVAATNLKICGVANYAEHKKHIESAGVYLCTARETFGIGTLEAMACGVPIAGWDYGGQSEIIVQGETGYLAPFGDFDALAECVRKCIAERARLGANARADVERRWQWRDKIEQYANLYKETLTRWTEPRPKVSVIVPCHNLAKYLPDALNSVARQTFQDWECVIVDDASTDNTPSIAESFVRLDARFRYERTPENLKLSRTLNYGHAHTRGKYVMSLDADNELPENTLTILADALDTRRDLHIVYGGLDTMAENGTDRKPNAFPYPEFKWCEQMAHLNQLHSSAMMRREVIEQSAGYRERQWRAEDAELWCRVSSFGFNIARVTQEPTLIYRWRPESKSIQERRENPDTIDGDWCEYFPWRTAKTGDDGRKFIAQHPDTIANPDLVPFGAPQVRPQFWNVYHRQDPLVSVIIPVGAGHSRYLNDALDSLVGQTMNEWEAIVVNDTGEEWDTVAGEPFARVIKTRGKQGAGAARNLGLQAARGALCFFLDADDMLKPNALLMMAQTYAQGDSGYIYSDAIVPESHNREKVHTAPEFTIEGWLKRGLHSQAVLMATEDARRIGFDESMPAFEDWDFFIRCVANGICGVRIAEPLLLYRKHLGKRSASAEPGSQARADLLGFLRTKHGDLTTGAKKMGCGGCNKKAANAIRTSRVQQMRIESTDKPLAAGLVRLRYTGARAAPVTYYANGHGYQAANTPKWRMLDVPDKDAEALLRMNCFERVRVQQPIIATPEPQPVVSPTQSAPIVEPEPPKEVAPVAPNVPPAPRQVDPAAMQAAVAAMEAETKAEIQPKKYRRAKAAK